MISVALTSTMLVITLFSWHTSYMSNRTDLKTPTIKPKRIVIHGINHARLACQAAINIQSTTNVVVELWSAPSASSSLGPAWFLNIINVVEREFSELAITGVLDCGDARGDALAALRQGASDIYISAPLAVVGKIRAIAFHTKACVRTHRPSMFDLMDHPDPSEILKSHFQ